MPSLNGTGHATTLFYCASRLCLRASLSGDLDQKPLEIWEGATPDPDSLIGWEPLTALCDSALLAVHLPALHWTTDQLAAESSQNNSHEETDAQYLR